MVTDGPGRRALQPSAEEGAAALCCPPVSPGGARPVTWLCSLGAPLSLCTLLPERGCPSVPPAPRVFLVLIQAHRLS